MAVQTIKNLIGNQVEGPIGKIKTQVKAEAKKEILKLREKLPTIEELKAQFLSMACSEAAKKKIEFLYNKIDGLLEILENISDKVRKKLEDMKNKLLKILEGILPKILDILVILGIAVLAAKIITKITPAAQAANSVPATGSPTLATKLQSALDWAKKKIKHFNEAIKAFKKKIQKVAKTISTIIKIVFSVVGIIILLGNKIKEARAFLLFLYLMFKSQCEVNLPGGGLNSGTCSISEYTTQEVCVNAGGIWNNPNQTVLDGNTSLLHVQATITSLYTALIEQLELEGNKEVIEIITNTVTNYDHKQERKIIPII